MILVLISHFLVSHISDITLHQNPHSLLQVRAILVFSSERGDVILVMLSTGEGPILVGYWADDHSKIMKNHFNFIV